MEEGFVSVAVSLFPTSFVALCPESCGKDDGSGLDFDFMIFPCMLSSAPFKRPNQLIHFVSSMFVWIGPGINFALSSLWLACAMSLAVFNIEKYVDGFGNVVEPKIHYTDGTIR